MTDSQCHSCGGFCKKSGCERENVKPPVVTRKMIVAAHGVTGEDVIISAKLLERVFQAMYGAMKEDA